MTATIRRATAADAPVLAQLRGVMQLDNGRTAEQVAADLAVWEAFYRQAVPAGRYLGWLAEVPEAEEKGPQVAGGVGVMFHPAHPSSGDAHTEHPHILNVAVQPAFRRRGIARALMQAALAWAQEAGYRTVTLNAAPMGQALYRELGFAEKAIPAMTLDLAGRQT
ncbi:GNAT family N-acetyltransferase [Deinococcus sp. Marseille-Q6407]|uniref:GNAT family N-acetyltransferase n=1 Tax=Deinococcus sp. Marseille-Q6407 TaxID=2969223 RepID=UPI0021C142EC|nr:N-acetyltransferase [Deinococcus sp. Marseille-Q6407]